MRRSWKREIPSVASVLALTAAILLCFPFEAFDFKVTDGPGECPASAAFVTLTSEQESAALIAARTSWQSDVSARQRQDVRLPLGELPDEPAGPLLDVIMFARPADTPEPVAYRPEPWKPSLRAEPLGSLPAQPETKPAPAFSREELLKLN